MEVYDLDPNTTSVLGNISTRASVASDVQTMPFAQLTASDVQTIINHAVTRAVTISPNSVIAVTDREGDVLGVWVMRGGRRDRSRGCDRRFQGRHRELSEQ